MRLLLIALLLTACALRPAGHDLMDGWVSDGACGAKHTKPGGENCVRLCMRGGGTAHPEWKAQKMVFVADGGGKIWRIANPSALAGFEGKHIRVQVARRGGALNVYLPALIEENPRER
jgi:hypothetical protein